MQPHRPQTSFHTPPIFPPLPRKRPPPSRTPSPEPPSAPAPAPRHKLHSGHRRPTTHLSYLSANALPPAPTPPSTLHQRHLATLTTLLHTSLAHNDLPRASRAYALLLRTPTTDIRAFWRLGVQLLLRRGEPQKAVELVTRLALRYPYQKHKHALHAALNDGVVGGENGEGALARPSVLEFVPALLEVLVLVGEGVEGGEGRAKVWERVEGWMVGPPWAEMRVMWAWRAGVAAWCADGAVGEEEKRWRGEEERAWRGFVERGGVVPEVARRRRVAGGEGGSDEEEGEEGEDEEEEEEEEEEEIVVVGCWGGGW